MSMPSIYQIAFALVKGITSDCADALLSVFETEENFFKASEAEIVARTELAPKIASAAYRAGLLESAKKIESDVCDKNVKLLYYKSPDYPVRFRNVPDAPLLLFMAGGTNLNAAKVISMVGTRHATPYGCDICKTFVEGIKEKVGSDVVIVSGLAYGIDIASHRAALNCGLPTVAVVAHGLDMIYPAQHRNDARSIVHGSGAIVSEYPFATRIHRSNFLARNRIIAALADATIVVESASKGGALVTANIALNYGRDVFAFPGRVNDEFSSGCNTLIRKNVAALITSVDDFIDTLGWEKKEIKPVQQELFPVLDATEQKIYDLLEVKGSANVNELVAIVGLPFHKLLSVLVDMEFRGILRTMPGNQYAINKKITL